MIAGITAAQANGSVGSGGASDPYWASVVSLVKFDGADAATSLTDEKGGTWSFSGNAKLSTAKKKFGTASLLCDGNGDYVESTKPGFTIPTSGDYTIEFFVNFATVSSRQIFLGSPGSTLGYFDFRRAGTPRLTWAHSTTIESTSDMVADTWYFVAACRTSGTLRLFIDGVQQGAALAGQTAGMNTAGVFQAGCMPAIGGASLGLNGNIDEFRFTAGVGRYTADFTVPADAFHNS